MISNNMYYIVHGWMLNLGIKDHELTIYAIIYGFSQDGRSEFRGCQKYLADFAGCTRMTVSRCINSLVGKGLVIRRSENINGVVNCFYRAVIPDGQGVYQNVTGGCNKMLQGVYQNVTEDSNKMLHNKEYIKNYIENSKSSSDEQNPIVLYERMMGPINMEIAEDIIEICETCGYENLEKALARAREQHTKNITYIRNAAKGIAAGIDFKEMAERKASKEKKGSLLWSV